MRRFAAGEKQGQSQSQSQSLSVCLLAEGGRTGKDYFKLQQAGSVRSICDIAQIAKLV